MDDRPGTAADYQAEELEDTMEGKFLVFRIGGEEYGIPIRNVTEIIGIQRITDLPDMPEYVRGVINLRGKVIPVIDVRARFHLPEREYDERTCIIVVTIHAAAIGLIVDAVAEVQSIPADSIEAPPKMRQGAGSQFLSGLGKVGDAVKILLDTHSLLYEEDQKELAEALA